MSETNHKEVTLKELAIKTNEWLSYLRSKWFIILIGCLCGVVLGYLYATYKKPKYVAASTFALEDANGGGSLGQMAGLASMVGIEIGSSGNGGVFQGDNLIELYKSRNMIQKSLLTEVDFNGKKQLLIDRYLEFNNLKAKWAEHPILKNINFKVNKNEKLNRA